MQSKMRRRLIILSISILVMLVLFALNVRRASELMLPPTPVNTSDLAAEQNISPAPAEANASLTKINLPATLTSQPFTPSPTIIETDFLETTAPEIDSQATAQAGMFKATQHARAMSNIVKDLYDDGSITKLDGYYKQLDEVSQSFNKPGYFRVSFSEYQAKYFVLRANVLWDNAGEEISYPTAGCGIIFGYQETSNQNRVVLTLDGNIRIQNIQGGNTSKPDPVYYGELDKPAGHANIILAADQGWITVYVNNQIITRVADEAMLAGWIGYAVEAGSSYDYGTLCEFKDIELWLIE